ncbi:MAG: DUF2283 domain-containing protein [Chloroflexi bacterium]|nr:DUF2283 domain-containing protein [Chloroflexota bacterium]
MVISYDKSADAMYIKLNDRTYAKNKRMMDGVVFDLDADGEIIGIEILYVSQRVNNPYEIISRYTAEAARE